MEEKFITVLISAFVSAIFGLIGVAASVLLSHYFTLARADKEFRLKKLEELLMLVCDFTVVTDRIYDFQADIVGGRASEISVLDIRKKCALINQENGNPHYKMWAIVDIFFPDLKQVTRDVTNITASITTLQRRPSTLNVGAGEAGNMDYVMQKMLNKAIGDSIKATELLKERIAESANEIRTGRLLKWLNDFHP